VANGSSGLEEVLTKLASQLGAAQSVESETAMSLAALTEQLGSGQSAAESLPPSGTAAWAAPVTQSGATPEAGSTSLATQTGPLWTAHVADGTAGGASGDAAGASITSRLAAAVDQLRAISQVQASVAAQTTAAATSSSSGSGGSSALETLGSTVAKVFISGLGIAPLISGLVSLFGGGGDSKIPPPLNEYTAPDVLHFEGDVYRGANVTDWSGSDATAVGAPASPAPQQITVQVNAMDSQSFLDHSQDIARAVRQAMLNSNSLNDVVSDL
jgi:hypothetical protein